jgi:DNA-binding NtrC family response regulator
VGESDAMRAVFDAIVKAASTTAAVLITGETGTGKELVARAIHYSSRRASAPFVPVNCGAIPEALQESELSGFVQGAFTGALESRAGFFQAADGGTLFLDGIGETSPSTQVRLLRVLADNEVCMVGSDRPRKVDVRVLAATRGDLGSRVARGAVRDDLYRRLDVVAIAVPPLRERADDALLLAHHFSRRFATEQGRTPPRFTDRLLDALMAYPWPGNVRELMTLVQGLIVTSAADVLDVADLPACLRFGALRDGGVERTLAEVESEHVRRVLAHAAGNKTRAARILGIDRKTLREKLKAARIEDAGD